jgi:adenylate kinase family enzyme
MRVAIIGIRRTGKSTLARKLREKFNVYTLFADKYIWDENWIPRERNKATSEILKKLESNQDWIFEGNFTYVADYIFKNADMVLYLDYSGITATIGCIKRWWEYRKYSEAKSAVKKQQKLELQYLFCKALLRGNRKKIESAIEEYKPKNVKRFKNRKELNDFLSHNKLNFSSNTVSRQRTTKTARQAHRPARLNLAHRF